MQSVHSHTLPSGDIIYLTGLEQAAEAGALLRRLTGNTAALLVGEVHTALTAQDEGATLVHLELLGTPQQRQHFGSKGLSGFFLGFPLGAKVYDSEGGRWLLDVTLKLTVSDYAASDDFALQTNFVVNAAVRLED